MKFGGLKCVECGGELNLTAGFDGCCEEAVSYNAKTSPDWDYEIALRCENCNRYYPICRTPKSKYISAVKERGMAVE